MNFWKDIKDIIIQSDSLKELPTDIDVSDIDFKAIKQDQIVSQLSKKSRGTWKPLDFPPIPKKVCSLPEIIRLINLG